MRSTLRWYFVWILVLLAITALYFTINSLKNTSPEELAKTQQKSIASPSLESNLKNKFDSTLAHQGSEPPRTSDQNPSGVSGHSSPQPLSKANVENPQQVSKATAKYLATLLSGIQNPTEPKEHLKAEAFLYLSALHLQAKEQQKGHAKTGLRTELIYDTLGAAETAGDAPVLTKFVLSLSAPSETVPGRFIRQDLFILGTKDFLESLVSDLGSELGKPPSKSIHRDQLPGPSVFYAAWEDGQQFHLYLSAEPAIENSKANNMLLRLSIEEKID